MTILSAIQRLQTLALACSSSDVTIRRAPDYPVEDASILPMSIAHMTSGTGNANNATTLQFMPVVNVDFHFNRAFLKEAYADIDEIALTFSQRLAGDPNLNGTVDTVVFPVSFEVGVVEYDAITTLMLRFSVPLKTLETPIST